MPVSNIKLTQEEYIEKCKERFGNKFDYSQTVYNGSHKKVKVICSEHGEFLVGAKSFIVSQHGCKRCAEIEKNKKHLITFEKFKVQAERVHNNKYLYIKESYTRINNKISIICPIHGEFQQTARSHIKGHGCKKCMAELNSKRLLFNNEIFISQAQKIHLDKYDYSDVEYINL